MSTLRRLSGIIVLLLAVAAPAAAEPQLRIGRISIRPDDIFTSEEASRGWLYRATNRLHMQTREGVIRTFLLFAEGEPYDPAKLAETERNLRRLGFIKSATVTASEPHDGVVDVDVLTQDSWTTEVTVNAGSSGGESNWGFELREGNFLGRGKQLGLIHAEDVERTRSGLDYYDPSFFRPYWQAQLLLTDNSDGSQQKVVVRRPFFSFGADWGFTLLADRFDKTHKIYADSYVADEFQLDERRVVLSYGRAISPNMKRASRLSAGVEWVDDSFKEVSGDPDAPLPRARDFHYVFGEYEFVENDFLKVNYVNRDLRYEDINLGRQFSTRIGISPKELGLDATTGLIRLSAADGHVFGAGTFLLPSIEFETRVGGGTNRNAIASANVHFVRKFATATPQTLVARAHADRGWDLDRDVQFFADGDTGLRAYRLHAFEGDKTLIFNLEHRVFLGRELWQILSPGAAVFVDSGTAAPPGRPLRFGDFKTDVGVGLRIGIARTTRNMLRLDLAYAIDQDPRGERGFLVSFSSAQAF